MGQSLACCSEQTMCQPEEGIPTSKVNDSVSGRSAQPSVRQNSPTKDGVLLQELEKLFNTYAGKDGKLGVAEIAKIWEKCAHNKVDGNLKEHDKRLIKESARAYLQKIDLDKTGRVSRAEFLSFMLGGLDRRGPFCQMQELLQRHIKEKPKFFEKAVSKFREWDVDGDGYVTRDELRMQMDNFLQAQSVDIKSATFNLEDILDAVDVDKDGRIDLWEFLAFSMGRRKVPVELLLYDITKGNSELFSSVLLGQKFEAIYHSSILVHGKEFWYGGNIFMSKPPMSEHFGPTLDKSSKMKLQQSTYLPKLKSVHLGYTLMTMDEIIEYQSQEMSGNFTPSSYDVLTQNCNHFSNHLARVLCGQCISEVITQQPQLVLDAPRMRFLIPLLNKWLGGFGNDAQPTVPEQKELMDRASSKQLSGDGGMVDVESDCPSIVCFDPAVVNGSIPSSEKQFAQVLHSDKDSVDLRYFDPKTCGFFVQQAPSNHLTVIDPKRTVGFNSIQSIASKAEGAKKGWLSRLRSPKRRPGRQPSQKALGRKRNV